MNLTYDDLDGLGRLSLFSNLLKTGTDTYGAFRQAKDARAIAQAQSAAAIAASNADAERFRAAAAQGAGSRAEKAKIAGYIALAAGLAVAAIVLKRRVGKRR